ncbi:hypothetical protein B5X24_HaOG201708 [Helicoverpa armigera]|nr:hypothetical protein B5X24_HaOG201708 [Helicoverpa armigera]
MAVCGGGGRWGYWSSLEVSGGVGSEDCRTTISCGIRYVMHSFRVVLGYLIKCCKLFLCGNYNVNLKALSLSSMAGFFRIIILKSTSKG